MKVLVQKVLKSGKDRKTPEKGCRNIPIIAVPFFLRNG
jgi:hypothetical protein